MKLIIADDSAFVRNILAKTITAQFPDAKLTLCSNGQEAWDAYKADRSDWLITDLLMPIMTGQALIEKIKKDTAHTTPIKIIVISADVQKGTRDEIEAYDIEAFINKPLTQDKLTNLVNHLKGE